MSQTRTLADPLRQDSRGRFRDQAVLALPMPQVDEVLACWHLASIDNVEKFDAGAVPVAATVCR
jgi:hypothetical protein